MRTPVNVAARQRQLIEDFLIIENRQERLAAIVDRARRLPSLPAGDRTEASRVPGCVSSVWILYDVREGRLHLRHDADSPLVKGLVALVCAIYDGGTPEDILVNRVVALNELDLLRDLTPTRQNGIKAVEQRIKAFAAEAAST